MRLTSPSRRSAGILAVTAIGLSTAVLSVPGIASAETPSQYVASANPADAPDLGPTKDFVVPDGTCAIAWKVVGADGDNSSDPDNPVPTKAGQVDTTTRVTAGQHVHLVAGVSAASGSDAAGGASTVTIDGVTPSPYVSAAGGRAGSGSRDDNVRPASTDPDPDHNFNGDAWSGGDGWVSADLINCPQAPYGPKLTAGDGKATLTFTGHIDDQSAPDAYTGLDAVLGFEYQVDGQGAWLPVTTAPDADDDVSLDIPLSNGVAHSVAVRSTSTAGDSAAVSADPVTPRHPVGAPTNVVVTPGASSAKVSWSAPTEQGTFPVGGYEVYISDLTDGNGGAACSTEALSCVIGLTPGHEYTLAVVSDDSDGYSGEGTDQIPVGTITAATAPATLPTGAATVGTGGSTALVAGKDVALSGAGFLPGSTVQFYVYSSPTALGSAVADDGSFTSSVTLPADLPNGTHHLVAAGVDANGDPYYLVTEITVTGGTAAAATPTGAATTGAATLAYTGFSALPYVGGGAVALLAGAGLIVAARRRQA